ncbi:MAG: hypothetical protein JW395_0025 [Nitrospira sp.]|nr:hypothetical protein [Nitrospira sp.]
MYFFASACDTPIFEARPNGLIPYTMPKTTVLATRRMSRVIWLECRPKISMAVAMWMSSPFANTASKRESCDRCARIRGSIWL